MVRKCTFRLKREAERFAVPEEAGIERAIIRDDIVVGRNRVRVGPRHRRADSDSHGIGHERASPVVGVLGVLGDVGARVL
jgi:hypothetical protein